MNTFTVPLGRLCLLLLAACAFAVPATSQCTTVGTAAYWQTTWAGCVTPAVLTSLSNPTLGTVATLRTSNLPTSAFVVGTFILVPPAPLGTPTTNLYGFPLLGGCTNYLPNAEMVLSIAFGSAVDVAIGIPSNPNWQGVVLHAQSAVLLYGATFDIEMSNAICLHLGT